MYRAAFPQSGRPASQFTSPVVMKDNALFGSMDSPVRATAVTALFPDTRHVMYMAATLSSCFGCPQDHGSSHLDGAAFAPAHPPPGLLKADPRVTWHAAGASHVDASGRYSGSESPAVPTQQGPAAPAPGAHDGHAASMWSPNAARAAPPSAAFAGPRPAAPLTDSTGHDSSLWATVPNEGAQAYHGAAPSAAARSRGPSMDRSSRGDASSAHHDAQMTPGMAASAVGRGSDAGDSAHPRDHSQVRVSGNLQPGLHIRAVRS